MIKIKTLIFIALILELFYGQTFLLADSVVRGKVSSGGNTLPFAIVGVKGTTYGAQADADGEFGITGIPPGEYTFIASSMGFHSLEVKRVLVADEILKLDFELEQSAIEIDGVAITGTLMRSFVKESPTKVSVVSSAYIEKIPTVNVMDVIENVNGLYQQIDCGVCGTNNIRINGIDGPYTAVLIDGMPIMSSLASVYGLNGISPSMIQQIEIIKGPMSTLYGSEAMGGVINVITKSPQTAPPLTVNAFRTSYGENAIDAGGTRRWGRWSALASATLFHNDGYFDDNGDNFADLTLSTRGSLFIRAARRDLSGRPELELSTRYYYEDRLGGTADYIRNYSEAYRGSDSVYGETILTHRFETMATLNIKPETGARFDMALNFHDQDSFYGTDSYSARQSSLFLQFLWPMLLNGQQTLMFGASLRGQRYDDNTSATGLIDETEALIQNSPDNRWIPGWFAQHEWLVFNSARLQSGIRIDYQQDYGWIPSPSTNLKVSLSDATTLRLNAGTGFRIVNLFTEDHAAYSSARTTVLLEDLNPERSFNGTASLQHVFDIDSNPLTVDLEGFYTYFTNKIEPDYSQRNQIVYANLKGSSTTRGWSMTLSQSLTSIPLSYTAGVTVMDVFIENNGITHPLEFAPDYQGVANASYRLPTGLRVDYTLNLTGPMKLPEYDPPFARDPMSEHFSVHNLQLTKDLELSSGSLLQPYIAVKNLINYTQDSPLVHPEDPFGENFDTSYIYGPLQGRNVGFGFRWFQRKY